MAFGGQTIARLVAVLKGFGPAATAVLLVSGVLFQGANIGGATVSLMGLALGNLVGVPTGRWLAKRQIQQADRYLPLLLSLLLLPLALVPAQPEEVLGSYTFSFRGWAPVLVGVAAALPLGVAMGVTWPLLGADPLLGRRAAIRWTLLGIGLGVLVATGAALILSMFRGTFLVNLFAAPIVWPILPPRGNRSLLARMLLTLVVLLSTMFLLFL